MRCTGSALHRYFGASDGRISRSLSSARYLHADHTCNARIGIHRNLNRVATRECLLKSYPSSWKGALFCPVTVVNPFFVRPSAGCLTWRRSYQPVHSILCFCLDTGKHLLLGCDLNTANSNSESTYSPQSRCSVCFSALLSQPAALHTIFTF